MFLLCPSALLMYHHTASTVVYFWLVVNSLFAACFGGALPWILLQEARKLRYMQGIKAKLFIRLTIGMFVLLGLAFALDVVNEHFWSIQMLHMFIWLFAAIFLVTFSVACWSNRQALRSLYPQEDFIIEQQKRRQLLDKLQVCDKTMPLPRFESKNGIIIYANRAALQVLEYSLQQLHALEPVALVHPADRELVLQQLLSQNHVTYECRILTASGRTIYVEVRTTHDPNDADIRITFLTDVTNYVEQRDRFMRELKLQRSTQMRREAEENLFTALGEPEMATHVG